jgi:hypothetical protein
VRSETLNCIIEISLDEEFRLGLKRVINFSSHELVASPNRINAPRKVVEKPQNFGGGRVMTVKKKMTAAQKKEKARKYHRKYAREHKK